jgi:hypothetical protein
VPPSLVDFRGAGGRRTVAYREMHCARAILRTALTGVNRLSIVAPTRGIRWALGRLDAGSPAKSVCPVAALVVAPVTKSPACTAYFGGIAIKSARDPNSRWPPRSDAPLPRQLTEHLPQVVPQLAIQRLRATSRNEHHVVIAVSHQVIQTLPRVHQDPSSRVLGGSRAKGGVPWTLAPARGWSRDR